MYRKRCYAGSPAYRAVVRGIAFPPGHVPALFILAGVTGREEDCEK